MRGEEQRRLAVEPQLVEQVEGALAVGDVLGPRPVGIDNVQPVDMRELGGDAAEIVPDAGEDRFDLVRRFLRKGRDKLLARQLVLLEARAERAGHGGCHARHALAVDEPERLDRADERVPQHRVAGRFEKPAGSGGKTSRRAHQK